MPPYDMPCPPMASWWGTTMPRWPSPSKPATNGHPRTNGPSVARSEDAIFLSHSRLPEVEENATNAGVAERLNFA